MTLDEVRRSALALPQAVEMDHHGIPSFRVAGKIFATLRSEPPKLMVKLDAEDQRNLSEAYPDAVAPVPGGWGRRGSTFVRYDLIEAEFAAMLLRLAWTNVAPKKLVAAAG
ncbi:MAG TPA: MmcQ/YjbR family DNA-binding protein [Caulobacteraceae bacterium]|nr:MmcQ/YjbR family DNA-binding protein [Caulobacteraceae bacterium]